ncbi:hypothetical protein OBRU01_16388 [Operophtera brumata]|uniref:Uncharacterized protein n=1 Tax=Operophtera brumata TaxID=104452 RepID=A0A0L7L3F2_OPEBR|nr:hypothetical protein OBRU01_16388 [Operophtera brumata]
MSLDCKDKLIKFYETLGYKMEPGNSNAMNMRFGLIFIWYKGYCSGVYKFTGDCLLEDIAGTNANSTASGLSSAFPVCNRYYCACKDLKHRIDYNSEPQNK